MSKAKTKICIACLCRKPVSAFHKNRRSKDGFGSYCKQCIKEKYSEPKEKTGQHLYKSEPSASAELMDEALNSCLERLCETEDNITEQKSSAEAVKAVMVDILKANSLIPMKRHKVLPAGSFRYYKGQLCIKLKP